MAMDVLSEMDEEKEQRQAEQGPRFTFLFLTMRVGPKKNGQPATVGQKLSFRPLYALDQSLLMQCHSMYNAATNVYTSAICAKEISKPCEFCRQAEVEQDKKLKRALEPKKSLMLPTWLHGIREQFDLGGSWFALTAKGEDGQEKPITGMRILELTNFGAIEPVFLAIRHVHSGDADEDIASRDIRTLDFLMECHGVQTDKKITPGKKDPSPITAEAKAAIPTRENLRAMILDARPPRVVGALAPTEKSLKDKVEDAKKVADAVILDMEASRGKADDFDF
jgi:hypothetical protein